MEGSVKKDVITRPDIELLVNSFYERVRRDELLSPLFNHVDWPTHLPVMYNFWSSLLLGDQSYQGSPFQKHLPLAIDATHFQQWLSLFTQTVDAHFTGAKADEVKSRAQSIAALWQHKKEMYK
ncbi:MAG: group III truncated hemoglobin [Cyclobacteriaceae bacterium]|jgi:hemoglobin